MAAPADVAINNLAINSISVKPILVILPRLVRIKVRDVESFAAAAAAAAAALLLPPIKGRGLII